MANCIKHNNIRHNLIIFILYSVIYKITKRHGNSTIMTLYRHANDIKMTFSASKWYDMKVLMARKGGS